MQTSLSLARIVFGFSHLARSHSRSDRIGLTAPLCCQNFGSIRRWKSKRKNAKVKNKLGKNRGLKAKAKTYIATLQPSENVKKKKNKKK